MNEKTWTVYLSGEIHSDWRERIAQGVAAAGLPVRLTAPVTVHADSDDCAAAIFGPQGSTFWHDHSSAKLNSLRTGTLISPVIFVGMAYFLISALGLDIKYWFAVISGAVGGVGACGGRPLRHLARRHRRGDGTGRDWPT